MKRLILYTIFMIFVTLWVTSCGKRVIKTTEVFQEAEIEDGPTCGCEVWRLPTLVYYHITIEQGATRID